MGPFGPAGPMIRFPAVAVPDVTVVIVTYGGWEWVERALRALLANTPPCYEVVIVDNASPDGTGDELERSVHGATIVRNARNVGFGAGANQGALHARARFLFFLNSDAFPQAGWLPPLVEVLDGDPGAGAVAPCLVEPDGRLQEAGGLLGKYGVPTQYGLGDDIDDLQFRFRRRVDFASGAALLVRRRDFAAYGGFDPVYGMGYFEDVDLCLGLWERGLATVYEPRSRVVHLRGASTNFAESQERSAYSHPPFMRRWSPVVARRPELADFDVYPHRLVASRDARATDRLVVFERPAADRPALADELARLCPSARLTALAVADASGDELPASVRDPGVELAGGVEGWEALFRARRFQYSAAVLRGVEGYCAGDELLRRFQPQAFRLLDVGPAEGADEGLLAAAVQSSNVVVAVSEEQRRYLHVLARVTTIVVAPPAGPDRDPKPRHFALADALLQLGIPADPSS